MKLTFLGTGTSTGVPQIGCRCETCTSTDPHDKRMRTSALVTTNDNLNLLIDCGPDFYHQMLRLDSPKLDALLLTHSHYDHIGGVDDLRPYCAEKPFPVYCQKDVADALHRLMPYSFAEKPYPGAPTFDVHIIEPLKPFAIGETEILPLPIMHYKLPILGFKIGDLTYITDCKTMPEEAIMPVDTLVLNALRHEEHLSHLSLSQALDLIGKIKPRVTYLTHMSHQMGRQNQVSPTLPPNVHFAHDGLTLPLP